MKVTQIILLTLFILSISASSASASLQLNTLFSFPVNFNLMQITTPFISDNSALANTSLIKSSTNVKSVSPAQSIISESNINHPAQITTASMPIYVPTPTPTPLPNLINPTPIPSPTPMPSPTIIPNSESVVNEDTNNLPISQTQKNEAYKIAANSQLCKEYNIYPDNSWNCEWASAPGDGHTLLVWKEIADGSSLEITVDLNTQAVVKSNRFPSLNEVRNNGVHH